MIANDSPPTRQRPPQSGQVPEPPRLSRRERELRRHRREALAATEQLLRDHGFHDITVQQIAERAEFSVGYLYKLFANKDEIFIALIREKKAALRELFMRELSGTAPIAQRLCSLVHNLFAWIRDNTAYATSSVRDLARFADLHEGLVAEDNEWHAVVESRIESFFAEAVAQGVLQGSPKEMTTILGPWLSGYTWERLTRNRSAENWEADAQLIAAVIMRAFAPDDQGAAG